MESSAVLVTGGCGFIGKNLVSHLLADGFTDLTVLDNLSSGDARALVGMDVELREGDVRDFDAVERATRGKDVVIHLAAQTRVMESIEDPETDKDINISGSLNLLRAAAAHDVRLFVSASSAAPLGEQSPPMHEEMVARPLSPYGASKLAVEAYCSAFSHALGLPAVSLRFSNVYGVGSTRKDSVIARFFKRILDGKVLTVYGDGEQTRDYVYIGDICEAILLTVRKGLEGGLLGHGNVFQLGTGNETSLNALIEKMRRVVEATSEYRIKVEYAPRREGEIIRNYACIDRFQRATGFVPRYELEKGLRLTWESFLQSKGSSS